MTRCYEGADDEPFTCFNLSASTQWRDRSGYGVGFLSVATAAVTGLMLRRYNLPHPSTDSVLIIIYCGWYPILSPSQSDHRRTAGATSRAIGHHRWSVLTGLMPLYTCFQLG